VHTLTHTHAQSRIGNGAEAAVLTAVEAAVAAKTAELEGVRAGLAGEAARFLVLTQEDTLWKSHLKDMNYVKVRSCIYIDIYRYT